ncbi:MAG: DoxX family protein [Isosphaeraceae bacterium]
MSNSRNWFKIGGLVLHVLIAALMIFASLGKLTGTAPAEVLESLRKAGLDGQLRLIGAGELITAIMLIVPWTASLGVLLASAFWGGAICTHMGLHTSVVRVSVGAAGADLGRGVPAAPRDVQQLLADECLSLWEG